MKNCWQIITNTSELNSQHKLVGNMIEALCMDIDEQVNSYLDYLFKGGDRMDTNVVSDVHTAVLKGIYL